MIMCACIVIKYSNYDSPPPLNILTIMIHGTLGLKLFLLHSLTNSSFVLCSPEELDESLKQWWQKIDDGIADQVIKDCDELRQKIGASTSVIGYKK